MVCDDKGKLIRTHSILDMQKHCQHLTIKQQVLRQESAYDEMIGCPQKTQNVLEVPIADKGLY